MRSLEFRMKAVIPGIAETCRGERLLKQFTQGRKTYRTIFVLTMVRHFYLRLHMHRLLVHCSRSTTNGTSNFLLNKLNVLSLCHCSLNSVTKIVLRAYGESSPTGRIAEKNALFKNTPEKPVSTELKVTLETVLEESLTSNGTPPPYRIVSAEEARTDLKMADLFHNKQPKGDIDVWWLYDDGGLTVLLPYLLTTREEFKGCRLRVFSVAQDNTEISDEQRNLAALLQKFRIPFTDLTVISAEGEPLNKESTETFKKMISKFLSKDESAKDPGTVTRSTLNTLKNRAYADDLALLVVADSRKKLETEVSSFLDDLSDNLKVLNLEVASEKTLVVVFRGTQNKNKQKKGALGSVGLSWVKAHAGIPGNELADQFAKSAITEGNFLDIPAPHSFLKKYIKNIILSDWQQHWGESDTGVRVREYVPFVDFNLLTHNRYLLFFISGHGPFPAYLFRFKILNSPNCICGGLGDPDHFVFDCPHSKDFHLTCPSGIFKPDWFSSVLKNVGSLRRLQEICVISNRICNELKSLN
ncbi:Bumetanide-sensitive sodium-(potassium)-chloride cotransporter [Araneus ventricosus]|uniref:Bumetanide-sensitive sodium-(Potassium)-chloride cotransporter n=1 Tax=Araneus ventricosus TaxID=182803 RepID=A0A4Y2PVN5_ARAVE|nr:Bumetanide-sensitive sodium-(potassium)-chloride cotransporter [Araneus ventricosus]